MKTNRSLFLLVAIVPSLLFGFSTPNEFPDWDKKTRDVKLAELRQAMLMEQERFDRFVMACLQTFDNAGKNYNDQWHHEIQDKAIQCANELMYKIDENLKIHGQAPK